MQDEYSESVLLVLTYSHLFSIPQTRKSRYLPEIIFSLGTVSEGHSWLNRSWLRKLFSCPLPALSPCSSKLQYSWVFIIFFLFLLFLWSPKALGLGSGCVTLIYLRGSPSQDPKRIINQALYSPKMKLSDAFHSSTAFFPHPMPTSTRRQQNQHFKIILSLVLFGLSLPFFFY